MTSRGRFISFEGIDGAGKSTQIAAVVARLQARGLDAVQTREPGGTAFAEALRALLLAQPLSARAETLAMFAARADHLEQVIAPALAAGRWVVCDRFTDATYAYQCGGRAVPLHDVAQLESWVHPTVQPDLTFLVDIDPTLAAARRGAARAADRFEAEPVDFFRRVRDVYLARAAAAPQRFCVLDGSLDRGQIAHHLLARLDQLLATAGVA